MSASLKTINLPKLKLSKILKKYGSVNASDHRNKNEGLKDRPDLQSGLLNNYKLANLTKELKYHFKVLEEDSLDSDIYNSLEYHHLRAHNEKI